MNRRDSVLALLSAALLAAMADPAVGKVYRIGFLWDSPAVFPESIEAFRLGLRDLGYAEGRNIAIEYRWAEGRPPTRWAAATLRASEGRAATSPGSR